MDCEHGCRAPVSRRGCPKIRLGGVAREAGRRYRDAGAMSTHRPTTGNSRSDGAADKIVLGSGAQACEGEMIPGKATCGNCGEVSNFLVTGTDNFLTKAVASICGRVECPLCGEITEYYRPDDRPGEIWTRQIQAGSENRQNGVRK